MRFVWLRQLVVTLWKIFYFLHFFLSAPWQGDKTKQRILNLNKKEAEKKLNASILEKSNNSKQKVSNEDRDFDWIPDDDDDDDDLESSSKQNVSIIKFQFHQSFNYVAWAQTSIIDEGPVVQFLSSIFTLSGFDYTAKDAHQISIWSSYKFSQ